MLLLFGVFSWTVHRPVRLQCSLVANLIEMDAGLGLTSERERDMKVKKTVQKWKNLVRKSERTGSLNISMELLTSGKFAPCSHRCYKDGARLFTCLAGVFFFKFYAAFTSQQRECKHQNLYSRSNWFAYCLFGPCVCVFSFSLLWYWATDKHLKLLAFYWLAIVVENLHKRKKRETPSTFHFVVHVCSRTLARVYTLESASIKHTIDAVILLDLLNDLCPNWFSLSLALSLSRSVCVCVFCKPWIIYYTKPKLLDKYKLTGKKAENGSLEQQPKRNITVKKNKKKCTNRIEITYGGTTINVPSKWYRK